MRYLSALSGKPKPESLVREYVADDVLVSHVLMFEKAFPLYEITADELIAEHDRVAVWATMRGIHQGPLMGIPPTGRSVSVAGALIYYLEGGKIVRHQGSPDRLTLFEQLGVSALRGKR